MHMVLVLERDWTRLVEAVDPEVMKILCVDLRSRLEESGLDVGL